MAVGDDGRDVRGGAGRPPLLRSPTLITDPLVDVLAAARLTRLVTHDELFREPRDAIIRWSYRRQVADTNQFDGEMPEPNEGDTWVDVIAEDDHPPKVGYLVQCPWCAGLYVSVGVLAARRYAPGLWAPVARLLAVAEVAGRLAAT